MYYTKEKSDLWHELQPKSFHLCSRTLLDPIIVSDTINYVFSDVFILPDNIIDHDDSVVILQCSKNISRSFKREIWQYKKINYEKFEEKLIEINWNEKLDHLNDVDEICEQFTKCFLKIAQECIPTNIITIRNNDRPWFNNEIRNKIRIRDRFRKTVLKFHRERDIKLYKKQRNKVNKMNKIAKENFEINLDFVVNPRPIIIPYSYYICRDTFLCYF
jgi:hypothetical protein